MKRATNYQNNEDKKKKMKKLRETSEPTYSTSTIDDDVTQTMPDPVLEIADAHWPLVMNSDSDDKKKMKRVSEVKAMSAEAIMTECSRMEGSTVLDVIDYDKGYNKCTVSDLKNNTPWVVDVWEDIVLSENRGTLRKLYCSSMKPVENEKISKVCFFLPERWIEQQMKANVMVFIGQRKSRAGRTYNVLKFYYCKDYCTTQEDFDVNCFCAHNCAHDQTVSFCPICGNQINDAEPLHDCSGSAEACGDCGRPCHKYDYIDVE